MAQKSIRLHQQKLARYFSLGLAVLAFSSFGVYLLRQSRAATVSTGSAVLSVAPANIALKQGNIVNLAVNVATSAGSLADDVEATITYPAQSVRLDAVRGACMAAGYKQSSADTSVAGTLKLTCKHDAATTATSARTTIATLVFTALSDSGSASITVGSGSVVTNQATGKPIAGSMVGSTVALQSRTAKQPPKPRSRPNYKYVSHCPKQADGSSKSCRRYQTAINADNSAVNDPEAGYGPVEWHSVYQLPCTPGGPVQAVCATPDTFGPQTVTIVGYGGYSTGVSGLESDFAQVNQKYGIPPCNQANGCLKVLNQNGKTSPMPPIDPEGDVETILDVSAVHEICQTCKITLILADNADNGNLEKTIDYAASLKPVAVSVSSGVTDKNDYSSLEHYFDHPDVPILIANGDDGTYPAGMNDWPSSLPNVISVTGTNLTVNDDGSRASEVLWDSSGGGCSVKYAAPAWQTALSNWGTAGCGTKRAEGDLSVTAFPGITVFVGTQSGPAAGTSLSAPLAAGMFGLANKPIPSGTQPSELLYKNAGGSNFIDITTGNNCIVTVKTHCTAAAGYDVPTGLGAPNGLGAFGGSSNPTPPPTTPPPTTPPPTTPPPTTNPIPGDINNDQKVNITDLSLLLKAWGTNDAKADFNASGKVDITDLSTLLRGWTG